MVAKKKHLPKPVKKLPASKVRELAEQVMADFKADAKKRYDHAHAIYAKQDDETQDALDRMVTLLCQIARKRMWVQVGNREDRLVLQIPDETVYHNMLYMAVEIMKDLAVMDIRIANYTHPTNLCAMCGTEIKKAKKKVKQ